MEIFWLLFGAVCIWALWVTFCTPSEQTKTWRELRKLDRDNE